MPSHGGDRWVAAAVGISCSAGDDISLDQDENEIVGRNITAAPAASTGGEIMARYLIVANQTLGGEQLVARIDGLLSAGPVTLRLVVPVTDTEGAHQWDYPPIDRVIPDAHVIAKALAEARLENELARLRRVGVDAGGEVVDANPVEYIREVISGEHFDEVIVSTLPLRLSRWLRTDLPHRLARALAVRVSHLDGNAGPSI